MKKNVLINASNLHHGGGVSVASSFIYELSKLEIKSIDISLLISTEVFDNLTSLGFDSKIFTDISIKDYYGISSVWSGLSKDLNGYEYIFTIFGPAYTLKKKSSHHVMGFAQPNIIYPNNHIYQQSSLLDKVKTRLKYFLQEKFFSLADELIVELEHVKSGVERRGFFKGKPIHIVHSAVDSIYKDISRWEPLNIKINNNIYNFGVISRNYPHKNLKILPKVKKILYDKFNVQSEMFVTFTDEEFNNCNDSFQNSIKNAGSLKLNQCPQFYHLMDGVIFPSLLECFSAVPIEAMLTRTPLFASDKPFIRDCCGNHANYFDPLDPYSVAESIYNYLLLPAESKKKFLQNAYLQVQRYSDSKRRALSYLKLIETGKVEKVK